MRVRLLAPLTAALIAGTVGLTAGTATAAPAAPAAAAAAAHPRATASSPIHQTKPGVGTFVGTFTPTGFTNSGGQLGVTGVLNGTFTAVDGTATTITNQATSTTVTAAPPAGSCNILNLVLGPLHLNVLGLVVDLNQVILNITAIPGAGNLLGNLLCAVAGLLNGSGTTGLANLLNQLLGL